MSQPAYSKLEGRTRPRVETRRKVAAAMNIQQSLLDC
ncbi:hypothetical protein OAS86_03420 [Gammaproteobacteria bacterium]|nr:hypothetical protein [Gammaproteobacteria bacterium]